MTWVKILMVEKKEIKEGEYGRSGRKDERKSGGGEKKKRQKRDKQKKTANKEESKKISDGNIKSSG